MERFLSEKPVDLKQLSPLTLAFIGDTVFDLLVREKLICEANRPANDLHRLAVRDVKASAQAEFVNILLPYFTEEEMNIYKRGRNAKSGQDLKFVQKAIDLNPDVLYSFHMASTQDFLIGYYEDNGLEITHIFRYNFPIPKIYDFHTKEKQNVDVIVIRAILK